MTSLPETQTESHLPSKVPKREMGGTKKSGSPSLGDSPLRTARCPLPAMWSLSPFSRSPSPLLPSGSSLIGSPLPLCPLNNEISNSQTFEPIGSLKSTMVDLVGEDQELEEQKKIEEEGEQEATNEDVDTKWNIDRKLFIITVDNCSTNDAMIRFLLNKLDTSSLMLRGSMLYMRCAAYILNLIVQDELSLIGDGIERIRDSVIYWIGSPKMRQKFDGNPRQLRVQCTKELVLDCKTRWNSTYLMLSTALIYKDVFSRLTKSEASYTCLPHDYDWKVAKDIYERLELFYSVTEFFSSRKYSTTNMYFTLVCELKIALNEWSLSSNEMISRMVESMLVKFNSYWANVNIVMVVAAILDPRYKMKLLKFCYPNIYDVDESLVDNEGSSYMPASTSNYVAQMKCKLSEAMSSFDLFVNNSSSSSKKHWSTRMEFDHFIDEGVLKRSEDFDILAWWKSNGLKYHTLQRIATDILAILVTTVATDLPLALVGDF
ncbi:zinc finger BED domain-containing protein RICESLEEPER 1-like [Castanea sativa]|uniref:zinc finger BED domain-containing protein RICESLEEPER 1-like n=1 Tax=Castanea sativa TaxID=21020 RepID=UPI003F64FF00